VYSVFELTEGASRDFPPISISYFCCSTLCLLFLGFTAWSSVREPSQVFTLLVSTIRVQLCMDRLVVTMSHIPWLSGIDRRLFIKISISWPSSMASSKLKPSAIGEFWSALWNDRHWSNPQYPNTRAFFVFRKAMLPFVVR
jgi:hypothetical protein